MKKVRRSTQRSSPVMVRNPSLVFSCTAGHTPLVVAALSADVDGPGRCGCILLDNGASTEAFVDDEDNTPLYHCIMRGIGHLAEALIRKGCDMRHVNKRGQLAICPAIVMGRYNVVRTMIEHDHGTPPLGLVPQPVDGRTVLETALRNGTAAVRAVIPTPEIKDALLQYVSTLGDADMATLVEKAVQLLGSGSDGAGNGNLNSRAEPELEVFEVLPQKVPFEKGDTVRCIGDPAKIQKICKAPGQVKLTCTYPMSRTQSRL
jgi:hypothetical protein